MISDGPAKSKPGSPIFWAIWDVIHQSGLESPRGGIALPHALDASLRVRKGAIFFGKGSRRKDHICILGGLRDEEILHHEEIQIFESLANVFCVGFSQARGFSPTM